MARKRAWIMFRICIEQAANFEGIDDLPMSVPNIMMRLNLLVNLHGKRAMTWMKNRCRIRRS